MANCGVSDNAIHIASNLSSVIRSQMAISSKCERSSGYIATHKIGFYEIGCSARKNGASNIIPSLKKAYR